jgi:hypothetical protein
MERMHTPSNAELREAVERELLLAALRLARAINGPVIKPATLKERAGALAAVADRALKFATAPAAEDEALRVVFEEDDDVPRGDDGGDDTPEEAARRPAPDVGESGALQGAGVWPAVWQDRAGQAAAD